MKNQPTATTDRGSRDDSEAAGGNPQGRPSSRLRRLAVLAALGVAIAGCVVVGYVYLMPPDDTSGPLATSTELPAAAVSEAAPPARRPTIMLPSVAVAATAEQLQAETEAVAKELRARFPEDAAALHVAAMAYAQLRQSGEAEKLWTRCIELAPKEESYYVNLAAIAMDQGNAKLAAETLQRGREAGFSSPDLYHHLGLALTKLGDCEQAQSVLQAGLAKHPKSSACWLVLGQAQLRLGQAAEAEASLRTAISLGSTSAAAYFALSNACERQGKTDEAAESRQRFTELKATQPLDPQQRFEILSTAEARRAALSTLCDAATVHGWNQDSLEAERLLLRALALDPSSPTACRALADLYQQADLPAEERLVRLRLVEVEPQNLVNCLDLAKVSARLGENESAEAALKLAISIRPQSADPFTTLAQFYLQNGRASQARWYAQEAVRRRPTVEAYVLLASTCRLLGQEQDAAAAFAEARKLAPGDPRLSAGSAP